MIKKSSIEEELIASMQRKLAYKEEVEEGMSSLEKAADYLHSAIQIFEDVGQFKKAEETLKILAKIVQKHKRPSDPRKIPDRATKGLTPDQMVQNLLHHGTEFNMSDDGNEDLLNAEIDENDLEVTESDFQSSFEDEK